MRDAYSEYLLERFPHLFSSFLDRYGKNAKYQFSVSDGWYGIIFDACAEVNRIIDNANDKGILVEVDTLQIKEKFGALRFYHMCQVTNEPLFSAWFRNVDEWIRTQMCKRGFAKLYWKCYYWRRRYIYRTLYEKVDSAITYAESQSTKICEKCGGEGRSCAPTGWLLTLCEKHEKETKKEYDEKWKKT
jgi:hypothetical protein